MAGSQPVNTGQGASKTRGQVRRMFLTLLPHKPLLTPLYVWKTRPSLGLSPEKRLAEGVALIQDQHTGWVKVWEGAESRGWKQVLLTAQNIWKRIERTCNINCIKLAKRVRQLKTRGGLELWNPHHYQLQSFLRKEPQVAQGGSRQTKNSNPSKAEKHLFDKMARTCNQLGLNLGALRQIASKKLKKW